MPLALVCPSYRVVVQPKSCNRPLYGKVTHDIWEVAQISGPLLRLFPSLLEPASIVSDSRKASSP